MGSANLIKKLGDTMTGVEVQMETPVEVVCYWMQSRKVTGLSLRMVFVMHLR